MEFNQLREFIALAEKLNFSEAAKQLYIAQPVLSRHIADLEQQLGVQLFIRDKHSVHLTTVGELLLNESQSLLAKYEETLQKIRLAASGMEGTLRVGYLEAPVKPFFAQLATRFHKANPHIQLHLRSFDFVGQLNQALLADKIDVGFTLSPGLSKSSGLRWQKIYCDCVCAIVRQDHPLAGENKTNLAGIAHEPLILFKRDQYPEGYEHVLRIYQVGGFTPKIVQVTPHIDTAILMVEMGLGIAILPRNTQVFATSAVRFIDLEGEECLLDVVAAWKTPITNPAILPFIKEIEVTCKDYA